MMASGDHTVTTAATMAAVAACSMGSTTAHVMTAAANGMSTATAYGKLAGMTRVMTTLVSTVGDMVWCRMMCMMSVDVVWCRMMCMMQTNEVMVKKSVMTSTKPKIQGRSVVITRIGIGYWRFYVLIVG